MATRKALVALAVTALFVMGFAGQDSTFKRERGGAKDAAKNALEGKKAPALQVLEWLNTAPGGLTDKDLRGKVVVLDFWAHW